MDLASILLFLALLVLVALFVARPLVSGVEEPVLPQQTSRSEAEYERVLDAILELDADWGMGKVPKEIYRSQRQQLVAKGTAALKKIEKEIKTGTLRKGLKLTDSKLEALITVRRKSRKK